MGVFVYLKSNQREISFGSPFWQPKGQSLGRKAAPFVDSRHSTPNIPL